MRLEYYQDDKNEWRWRARASNGKIVADGSEGYTRREDCERGVALALMILQAANWHSAHHNPPDDSQTVLIRTVGDNIHTGSRSGGSWIIDGPIILSYSTPLEWTPLPEFDPDAIPL
jgi:uncharacterized protein YegP (UPF0339 family)